MSKRLPTTTLMIMAALAIAFAFMCGGCEKKGAGKKSSAEKKVNLAKDIKKISAKQKWSPRKKAVRKEIGAQPPADLREHMELRMNRELLEKSFELGANFLVVNQTPEGNFNYMYDCIQKKYFHGDRQVRQAAALWGVALCYKYRPTTQLRESLDKGLKFWFDATVAGPDNTLFPQYKSDRQTSAGTVALVALSLIEYLTAGQPIEPEYEKQLRAKLDGYLAFLQWLQLDNGHVAKDYFVSTKNKSDTSSPYYDGETLLAWCKAARLLQMEKLVPTIERAARSMAETYTVRAWRKDRDSAQTKGFYQWGSMAFTEYYFAKWKDYQLYGDITMALGNWMIHVHRTLRKGRNHAYALEGLISSYRIAQDRGDVAAMVDLHYVIDRSLYKLTAWQIGGPLADQCKFLVDNPTDDPLAIGGVMNAKRSGPFSPSDTKHELRIDVTQHQMHAVTMALEYVYAKP